MPTAVAAAGVGAVGSIIAGNKQAKAIDKSTAIQREQLEFQQERYNDWKAVYGELQEDMGEYFKNLTGKDLSNREVEQLQLAGQKAQERIDQALAQRGIEGSGLQAQLLSQNTYGTEMAKAQSRATAEDRAMNAKANFLRIGLGQGQAIANTMSNTTTNLANLAIKQGNIASTTAGSVAGFIAEGIYEHNRQPTNSSTGGN